MMLRNIAIGASLLAAGLSGGACSSDDDSPGPLGQVDALVVLQRPKRIESGDIFQYTSYVAGARLVKLSPPTADGKLETLFPTEAQGAEFASADISGYDISFDAKQIVFSAKLREQDRFGLF